MNVLFWHRKNKINGRGEAPIYCRITINGERTEFSTNIFCGLNNFNAKKQIITGNEVLNLMIANIKQKINALYLDLTIKEVHITAVLVKDYMTGKQVLQLKITDLFTQYLNHRHDLLKVNELNIGTYKKSVFYINSILEYLRSHNLSKITPQNFTSKLGNELYYWLQNEKKVSMNHAARTLSFLKGVFNFGISNEICSTNHIQNLRFKRGQSKKIEFLQPNEVEALQKHKFASIRLQEVADLFLFQCYTGLSYADLAEFCPVQHIETAANGKQWIIKNRAKNAHESVLPYNVLAKAIVLKYTYFDILGHEVCKLPTITNQKYNSYLKEVGEIMGFKTILTTHIGRKTFGTIALNDGFTIEAVSRMLGHTNIKTTQSHYAVVLRKRIEGEMQ